MRSKLREAGSVKGKGKGNSVYISGNEVEESSETRTEWGSKLRRKGRTGKVNNI